VTEIIIIVIESAILVPRLNTVLFKRNVYTGTLQYSTVRVQPPLSLLSLTSRR